MTCRRMLLALAIVNTALGMMLPPMRSSNTSGLSGENEEMNFIDDNNVKDNYESGTLRQVTIVVRHGERTPADTYPNDPYINDTMAPYGWGQLTNVGKLNQYNQGIYLRKRYGNFLGTVYKPDIFWLQSTAVDRTQMSALLEAAGLWKPDHLQTFKKDLPWQPVTLHYQPLDEDTLLLVRVPCPAYSQELERVKNSTEIRELNENNEWLYEELTNFTGQKISNPDDVMSLYSTLKAEADLNLTLPRWTNDYYPQKFVPLTAFSFVINSYNNLLRRLKGGLFVKKIVNDMMDKSQGTLTPPERKMFLYTGHDSTVTNLLSAMQVWDVQVPGYNIMTMIELHKDHHGWNVQMYLRNSTQHEPHPLTLPGCTFACPLTQFVKLLEPVIPIDWDAECIVDDPNYVPPTPLPP